MPRNSGEKERPPPREASRREDTPFCLSITPPQAQEVENRFMPPLITQAHAPSTRHHRKDLFWSEIGITTMDGVVFSGRVEEYLRGPRVAPVACEEGGWMVFLHHIPDVDLWPYFTVAAMGRRISLCFKLKVQRYRRGFHVPAVTKLHELTTPDILVKAERLHVHESIDLCERHSQRRCFRIPVEARANVLMGMMQ
jgi:hypothetical protein